MLSKASLFDNGCFTQLAKIWIILNIFDFFVKKTVTHHNWHFLVLSSCLCLSVSVLLNVFIYQPCFDPLFLFFFLFSSRFFPTLMFGLDKTIMINHWHMENLPWPAWTIFLLFAYYDQLHIYICKQTKKPNNNNKKMAQQRAARNLAVSVTYQEWPGPLCGLLLLAAHHMKAMRSQGHCTAVAPPSPPFCSGNDEHWLAAQTWMNRLTCVNDSKNIRRARMEGRKSPCFVTLTVGDACVRVADWLTFFFSFKEFYFQLLEEMCSQSCH